MGSWPTSPRDARGREQHSHWPVRLHTLRSTVALQYPPTAATKNCKTPPGFWPSPLPRGSRQSFPVSQFPSTLLSPLFCSTWIYEDGEHASRGGHLSPKTKEVLGTKADKTKSQGRKEKRSRATGSPRHSVGQQGFTGSGPKGLGVGDDLIIFIVGRSTESLLLY